MSQETREGTLLLKGEDGSRLLSVSRQDGLFEKVIRLVTTRYQDVHGARVSAAARPFLVLDVPGEPDAGACLAVTPAASGPLFSECYLRAGAERSCEAAIARALGRRASRSEIVEFGTFAAFDPGSAISLFELAPLFAWLQGARYVLMTAIPAVRELLRASGMRFQPLVAATPLALPAEDRAQWGSYYEQGPITGFLELSGAARRALARVVGEHFAGFEPPREGRFAQLEAAP